MTTALRCMLRKMQRWGAFNLKISKQSFMHQQQFICAGNTLAVTDQ
jgi:hypothetical protein